MPFCKSPFKSAVTIIVGLSTIYTDFDTQHPTSNVMNTKLWATSEHLAQHMGVAKDTVYRERKGVTSHRTGRLPARHLRKYL